MSSASQAGFVEDAWQTPRNARTLRAFMALQQAEIGARIAALRKKRGNPPQEVVASKLSVSYRAYQAWEAGDTKPSYRNLEKLAEFYGVTPEYILMGGEEIVPEPGQLDRIEAKLDQLLSLADRVERLEDQQAADRLYALADELATLKRSAEANS